MIQTKCIQKFRDKKGKIIGYRLQDLNGKTQDVASDNLKNAILKGDVHVVNLTLTSDGRLVDSSEKILKNTKVLGKAPIADKQIRLNKIAKYISEKCNYNIDEESLDDESITLNKNSNIPTYVFICNVADEQYEISIGSNAQNLEFEITFELIENDSSLDMICTKINGINYTIDSANDAKAVLKIFRLISENSGNLFGYMKMQYLNNLCTIYNIDIAEVIKLLQERIHILLKKQEFIELLRADIVKASSHNYHYTLRDDEENDKELVDNILKAALCLRALLPNDNTIYESAVYFYQESDIWKQLSYSL